MAQKYYKTTLNVPSGAAVPPLGISLTLTYEPAGFQDFEITYKRHNIYGTIFRSIGGNLRFANVKGGDASGYNYLKYLWEQSGNDAECEITIQEQQLSNKTYSTIYEGVIDFSNYNQTTDFIEVGILDNSLMNKFFAREEMNFDIIDDTDIDGNTISKTLSPYPLGMSPIEPLLWTEDENDEITDTEVDYILSNITKSVNISGDTILNLIGSDFNTTTKIYTNNSGASQDVSIRYKATIDITGSMVVTGTPSPSALINFLLTTTNTDVDEYEVSRTTAGTSNLSHSVTVEGTLTETVPNGNSIGLVYLITGGDGGTGSSWVLNYDVDIQFETYEIFYNDAAPAKTSCNAYKPFDVAERLLEKMGIDTTTYPFTSIPFDTGGDYEFIMLTSGRHIRQFPSDTPLNISFRTFFENYGKALGLLFVYDENGFRIEDFDYFYDGASGGIGITEVSNVEFSTAEDKYYSRIKVGYPNQDYETNNGNIEFNTEFEYATANKNTNNILDLISQIRADSIGIEQLRRQPYLTEGDIDNDSDKDLFFISALFDGTEYRPEIGSDFTSVTGLRDANQYYNYRLTPKSNQIRNYFHIGTSLNYLTDSVKYNESKNNIPLIIDSVEELGSATGSGSSLTPIYCEFDTQLTSTLLNFLETSLKNTIIEIPYNGSFVLGFLEEAKINLYTKEAHIKMILD